MKKLFALFFTLTLLLCGCRKAEPAVSNNSDIPTSSSADTSSVQPTSTDNPYSDVIADYKSMVLLTGSDEFSYEAVLEFFDNKIVPTLLTREEDMGKVYGSVLDYGTGSIDKFGYKLIDMNNDGTSELFLIKDDEYAGIAILAVYTYDNGAPKLLSVFWPRYKAVLSDGKKLHVSGASGAAYVVEEIAKLANGKLVTIEVFGTDGYDEEKQEVIYFRNENDKQIIISEKEAEALYEKYPFNYGSEWNDSPLLPLE